MDASIFTDSQRTRLLSILHTSPVYKEEPDERKPRSEQCFLDMLIEYLGEFFEEGVEWGAPNAVADKAMWHFGRGCAALSEGAIDNRAFLYGEGAGKMLRDEADLWRSTEARKARGQRKCGTAPWKHLLCSMVHPICEMLCISFKEHGSSEAVKLIKVFCEVAKVPIKKSTPISMVREHKVYLVQMEEAATAIAEEEAHK